MGYPDEIKEIWSKLIFDEDASYLEAMQRLFAVRVRDMLDKGDTEGMRAKMRLSTERRALFDK